MINTQSFKLDIKKPTIPRLRVVNGDTANRFVITVQDDGVTVSFSQTLHKIIAVFTRADGQVYTQDADTDVSFTDAGVVTIDVHPASFRTGTNKVCLQIYKREDSSATEYPLLCTTNEAQFTARKAAIPDSGAPNAPSQLPMLEQLISDAQEAIDDCEDATEAANDAADAANDAAEAAENMMEVLPLVLHVTSVSWDSDGELQSIEFEESASDIYAALGANRAIEFSVDTTHMSSGITIYERHYVRQKYHHLTGSSSPYRIEASLYDEDNFGNYCWILLATDGTNIICEGAYGVHVVDETPTDDSENLVKSGGVYTALAGKQNTLTLDPVPTHGSDHYVNSGVVYDAIRDAVHEAYEDASTLAQHAAEENVYLVKHDAVFTAEHPVLAQGYTDDYGDNLHTIAGNAVFATQITTPNGDTLTLYEYNRDEEYDMYYLKSEVVNGVYVTCVLDNTNSHHTSQIEFELHNAKIEALEKRAVGQAITNSLLPVERVTGGTKVLGMFMLNAVCAPVGYAFHSSRMYFYVLVGYNFDFYRYDVYALERDDANPTEITLENAESSQILTNVYGMSSQLKYGTGELNAENPYKNVRFVFRAYDEDDNEIDRFYSVQYRVDYNNGSPTVTRTPTAQQPRCYVTEIGIIEINSGNGTPAISGCIKHDGIDISPIISTYQSYLQLIIPDEAFADVTNGYLLSYKDGHGYIHGCGVILQAPAAT